MRVCVEGGGRVCVCGGGGVAARQHSLSYYRDAALSALTPQHTDRL